ncbi:MAG: phosphatase PAP2 family protein [Nitrospira sp.]|nr:MAG: phosphatase PAP2 family protein [Nitrospira sp.]
MCIGHMDHSDPSSSAGQESRVSFLVSLACLCVALGCVFWGLRQLDGPTARYLRTITTPEGGGTLTVPWMAFVSQAGNWIGDGRQLLIVSAILLAVGWMLPASRGLVTGVQTLWAHGLATVLVHTVKHLVGRPRPKFSVSGDWSIAPSLASGFDSFPSGHTTATFALAVVLSRRFPLLAAVFIGIAAFVSLSRVLRGSHFPSDVFGGWVLGTVSGMVAANPWKDWIQSVESALYCAAIGTVWGFALFWSLAFPVESGQESLFLIGGGALLVVVGVLTRIRARWSGQAVLTARSAEGPILAMAIGLSLMSAAPIVMAAVGLLCVALWFRGEQAPSVVEEPCWAPVLRECELAAAVLLSLAVLVAGRGVLPLA